jgi:hypothetical protein
MKNQFRTIHPDMTVLDVISRFRETEHIFSENMMNRPVRVSVVMPSLIRFEASRTDSILI